MNAENVFKCYLIGSSYLVQYHLNGTVVHSKVVNLSKHQNIITCKYIVYWEFYLIYFQDLLTCHLPDLEMAPSKRSQLRCVFTMRFVGVSFNRSQCRMAALGRTRQTPRTTNKLAQNCSIQTQTPHCTDIKHKAAYRQTHPRHCEVWNFPYLQTPLIKKMPFSCGLL